MHAPEPEQAPDHPENVDPTDGDSMRATDVPAAKLEEQPVPQLIPEGMLVTVPAPRPVRVVPKLKSGTKTAWTATFEFSRTVQVLFPAQAEPDQPAKTEPDAEVAESVTEVPELNVAVQVDPQLMPVGVLLTTPLPAPAELMDNANCGGGAGTKLATTFWLELRVTLQPPLPVQLPLHPAKIYPLAGLTTRAIGVPETKELVQTIPQLIPSGLLLIEPPDVGEA